MPSRHARRRLLWATIVLSVAAVVIALAVNGVFTPAHHRAASSPSARPSTTQTATPSTPPPSPTATPSTPGAASTTATVVPVLGVADFMPSPPVRKGYGSARPAVIDNDGDPGSQILSISWTSWGGPDAYGTGLTYIPQLNAGWYPGTVPAQLHATGLGACGGTSGYRALYVRVPSVPGGPMGAWRLWDGTTDLCHPGTAYWPQLDFRTLPKAPNCPSGYEAYGNPGTASQMCLPPEYIPGAGASCPAGSAASMGPVLCLVSSTPANIVVPVYRG